MITEIISTDKGWRIKTGKNAYLKGYFNSFVKAEAEENAYIKRSKVAREKQKNKKVEESK